jgi:quercetin dioxygenase-like cupin family protein
VSRELELTGVRTRSTPSESMHPYEVAFAEFLSRRELAKKGRVVLRGRDAPWQQSRQGMSKYLLHDMTVLDSAVRDWVVFLKDIPASETGCHTHQGGLIIYVTRGRGWSVLDGVRYDWKEGDLLVLPIQPGGCEHQHFRNETDDVVPQWIAFVYLPFVYATGSMMTQVKEQKGWQDGPAVVWDR